MSRARILAGVCAAGATLGVVPVVTPASAATVKRAYPNSIAALGDSITTAFNTERRPFTDGPAYSWATGTKAPVESVYERILAANPAMRGRRSNLARGGARMRDLVAQSSAAARANPEYVTVLLGANDVCRPSEDQMTPVGRFRAELEAGMRMLTLSLPDARIQLITIPDVYRLWSLFRGSVVARTVWDAAGVCQSLLARPRSTAEVDQDRRARVRARTRELNAVLADVCGRYVHCRHDAGAVFDTEFSRSDVSLRDFFHPSRAGQAKLAEVAWRHTFDFRDALPPVSLPLAFPIARGTSVVLSAVDDRGVAGIEYRLARARWTRYTGPVVVPTARALEYRAVDVNGNTERSRILVG